MEFAISPTLGINERIAGNPDILNFGLGQSPFPVISTMVEALRENAFQKNYINVQGLRDLRSQIAEFHLRNDDILFNEENIIIGPGSKELIFSLLFVHNADVFIPTPCWVTYPPQCQMTGRKPIFINCDWKDNWKLTPALLENTFRDHSNSSKKLIILNYPNNPCGYTYSKEEIQNICTICDAFDVTIVSDEIYGKITHNDKHFSTAKFSSNAILSSGISKWAGAGGWRLGYMAFNDQNRELLTRMRQMVSETFTSVSAPIQHAAIKAFEESAVVDEYLGKARKILSILAIQIRDLLADISGLKISQMDGGFYFFLDASDMRDKLAGLGISTSNDLANYLLDEYNLASLPGSSFGRSPNELSLRFSFVDFDGAEIMRYNLDNIDKDLIQKHCHRVIAGVQKLKQLFT